MKFSRRSETLQISGQDVVIFELSAAEFAQVMTNENDTDQLAELLRLSLNDVATTEDILSWPNSIVNQISDAVMLLNGLTDSGT